MLSPNIIILFDGAHANIPTGFTRETALDGLFPKSSGAEAPNVDGGSATHSHTSTAHSHTLANHTHSYSLSAVTSTPNKASGSSGLYQHSHSGTSGGSSGGTTNTTAVTYGAVSNLPPYYEFVPIKSTGYSFIPPSGVLLSKNSSRTGLTFHAGSAGKFIKLAPASGNAGSTGGSNTNVHNIDHTHTTNTHTHADSNCGSATNQIRNYPNGNSGGRIILDHTHVVSVNAGTQAINAYSGSLTTTETVEPAFATLNAFKNESVAPILPAVGDIAMWLGSVASIPVGWALCDGNNDTPNLVDKFIKLNSSAGASTTGGSNTHTHSAQSHTHTSNGTHTHTAPNTGNHSSVSNNTDNTGGGVQYDEPSTQTHAVTVSASTGSYNSSTTSANESDNQPPYITVAYIQLQFQTGGGAIVKRLLG